jgi:hypothetical protein
MRAFLGGRSVPREEFAIAGIGEATGVPAVLLLDDGEVFIPEDYISLGYTNYEVWCVGAVGGRGGDAVDEYFIRWRVQRTVETMPDWVWTDEINRMRAAMGSSHQYGTDRIGQVYLVGGTIDTTFVVSNTPPPVGVIQWNVFAVPPSAGGGFAVTYELTADGWTWFTNPNKKAEYVSYLEPIIQEKDRFSTHIDTTAIGGGGGGGGLHVIQGFLTDLPDSVVAAVGRAGADGAPGQLIQPSPWNPSPAYDPVYATGFVPEDHLSHARWDYHNRFPNGHPLIGLPAEGSPGGASSFGDICKASGGKGGKPAIQWAGATRQQYAYGGQGGRGGQTAAGGGADGATASSAPGKDGGWDGSIGSGGGGGRGGPGATDGGRGSLSYGDTSVYGDRGNIGSYSALVPKYAQAAMGQDWLIDPLLGVDDVLIPTYVNPGSGGGARIPGNRKYGSRARGYIRDGAVLVRLTKVD